MQENFNPTPNQQFYAAKPDNNLVWAILTTVCCCLPFGIVSIVYAAKVNGLWDGGQYDAAKQAADEAKKWAIIGAIVGLVVNLIWAFFYFVMGFAAMADM